jgi:hypothetical protein
MSNPYNRGMQERPRLKFALIAALVLLPLALGLGVYLTRASDDTGGRKLPSVGGSDKRPDGLRSGGGDAVVRAQGFTLDPVANFSYTRRSEGGYTQITIRERGQSTPRGVLVVSPTQAQGLGELVAIQTGGYNPQATTAPKVRSLKVGGRAGAMVTTDLLNGTIRVAAVTLRGDRSYVFVFSGPLGDTKRLESTAREHANALHIK